MREIIVFYAWQSSSKESANRHLIRIALEEAANRINQDTKFGTTVIVDSDTQNVPGQPPVTDTILEKIRECDVFMPDVTLVAKTGRGKLIPNANVMLEFVYALHAKTHSAFMSVMNTTFGGPDNLPFDMGHLRHPIQYELAPDAPDARRREMREKLSQTLETKLRQQIAATAPAPPPPAPFVQAQPSDGPGRFRAPGTPLGIKWDTFSFNSPEQTEIFLSPGPTLWLRVRPTIVQNHTWAAAQLKEKALRQQASLMPFTAYSCHYLRAEDGFGMTYLQTGQDTETCSIAFAFETGEVWSIDTYYLASNSNELYFLEKQFCERLSVYTHFLRELNIAPPFAWEAGFVGVKNRNFRFPNQNGFVQQIIGLGNHRCLSNEIVVNGTISSGESAAAALKPFFKTIFLKCGLERPDYLDQLLPKVPVF